MWGPPVGICLVLIIVFGLVFICYRDKIRLFVYAHPNLRAMFYRPDAEDDKEFDVFISYAHQDHFFVEDQLVPMMEEKNTTSDVQYRCLVPARDFVPGEAILSQIENAVRISRRTLIFLSRHFVTSTWTKHE